MKTCLATLTLVLLCACSSTTEAPSSESGSYTFEHQMSEKDYRHVLEKYTRDREHYDGFMMLFQYHVTLLSTEVLEAQVWQSATDLQWAREKVQVEREKVSSSASRETTLFLSFFSPDGANDNLEVTGSIWKLFLVSGGTKYEGKATRTSGHISDLQKKYPFHTRFNTAYTVTFPVPVTQVQSSSSRFIITGPVATSEVNF
jgi:hypothetical protein